MCFPCVSPAVFPKLIRQRKISFVSDLSRQKDFFENVDKNRPSLHVLVFAGTYHFDDEAHGH